MSCSVNLVPAARLVTRARTRRRSAWAGTCVVAAGLVAGGWLLHRTAEGALERLAGRVSSLETRRAQVQAQVSAADAERTALFEQLRTIAGARHPQPWARRLMRLAQHAPEGVFLTTIEIASSGKGAAAQRGRVRPRGEETRPGEQAKDGAVNQVVNLTGYALDHGALIQLLNTLQTLPEWGQAELIQATSDRGATVQFQVACRLEENTP
jgi:hypothetical protein